MKRIFWSIYYGVRLFLRIDKPYKYEAPYYYKVTAVNAPIEPETPEQVATVKDKDGRVISFEHVPGATGYAINGNRTEIIMIK